MASLKWVKSQEKTPALKFRVERPDKLEEKFPQ